MRRKSSSKSSLFLLEMMIAIIFFALAASVCIQAFGKVHLLGEKAHNLQMARSVAADAMEEMSMRDTPGEIRRLYDRNWNRCGNTGAYFVLEARAETTVNDKTGGEMRDVYMKVRKVRIIEPNIFEMSSRFYVPAVVYGEQAQKTEAADE